VGGFFFSVVLVPWIDGGFGDATVPPADGLLSIVGRVTRSGPSDGRVFDVRPGDP